MNIKTIFLSLLLPLIFHPLNSQELQRKASLGAQIGTTESGVGVLVQRVLNASSAQVLGLAVNDIIHSVNGLYINLPNELIALISNWRAGDRIEMEIERNGVKLVLNGTALPKPTEQSEYGTVSYEDVVYRDGRLRSILEIPHGVSKPPVLFYIQGFSCYTIDFYHNPADPVKQLTEGLVKEGIAVYRVEKPGIGDSFNEKHCDDIGYEEELEVFRTALKGLKNDLRIDSLNIFLFGHSLGGLTAPIIARDIPVKGIVNYGSVFGSWYDYLLRVLTDQDVIRGVPQETIDRNYALREPLLHDYLILKKTPDELRTNPSYKAIMSTGLPLIEGNRSIDRHYSFMQEISDTDPKRALAEIDSYVLAIHGEHDIHAIDKSWAEQTANWVNAHHPGKGFWQILENTEHGFALVSSMQENLRLRAAGELNSRYMSENYNPELHRMVYSFINSVKGEPK